MKWLKVLCRSVAFFVAAAPPASYSRTVQPVTYSYTTTNDGEYTETYQDGMRRIYNRVPTSTPYSLHPSVLAHHYYDHSTENRKVESVVSSTSTAAPRSMSSTTRKPLRKKNDYTAKVSYVQSPESVSFATTIEDKSEERPATEPPMRKLVVRKRRPLKPTDEIPVQESNGEESQSSNYSKNFKHNYTTKKPKSEEPLVEPKVPKVEEEELSTVKPKSAKVVEASPADVYNKVKQTNMAAGLPSNVRVHKVKKIRLKPTTTSTTIITTTTTTTTEELSTTTDAPMWEDVLHEPLNTTQEEVKSKKRTKPSTQKPSHWKKYATSTSSAPESSNINRVRVTSTSALPPTTKSFMKSGKYTSTYEDNPREHGMYRYKAESASVTTELPKAEPEEPAEDAEEEPEPDESPDDLEYPDEYDNAEEENASEDNGENAENSDDSPIKLLKKPMRYSYLHDQAPSASHGDHHGQHLSHMKKVHGEKHTKGNHQKHGDKGDIGFAAREVYDHAKKALLDKKNHKHHYDEEGGHKKKDHEEHGHLNEHEVQAAGKKAAEYKESGKHQKGHSTKGSHNVHKKNEYMKKHEFYDEHHEGDSHEKYNDYIKGHKQKSGGAFKHAHRDKDYSEGHDAKKGRHHKGHYIHDGNHHLDSHGSKEDYGNANKYNKHDGISEDKRWKYEKAKDTGSDSES